MSGKDFEIGDALRDAWKAHESSGTSERIRLDGDMLDLYGKLTKLALPGTSFDANARILHASEAARLEAELAAADFSQVMPEDII